MDETRSEDVIWATSFSGSPDLRFTVGTKLWLYVSDSKPLRKPVESSWREEICFTITHLPWHMVRLEDTLAASVTDLLCPEKVCDHGKGGKPVLWQTDLPKRGSVLFLEEGLAASRSKECKSFGGGSARRSKTSFGLYSGDSTVKVDVLIFSSQDSWTFARSSINYSEFYNQLKVIFAYKYYTGFIGKLYALSKRSNNANNTYC